MDRARLMLLCLSWLWVWLVCSTGCVWRPQLHAGGDITLVQQTHVNTPDLPELKDVIPTSGITEMALKALKGK